MLHLFPSLLGKDLYSVCMFLHFIPCQSLHSLCSSHHFSYCISFLFDFKFAFFSFSLILCFSLPVALLLTVAQQEMPLIRERGRDNARCGDPERKVHSESVHSLAPRCSLCPSRVGRISSSLPCHFFSWATSQYSSSASSNLSQRTQIAILIDYLRLFVCFNQ